MFCGENVHLDTQIAHSFIPIFIHIHMLSANWLSTMSHTLSTTLRNSRSNHHPQGTYNPVKLLLLNESVEMRTQISMLLWEKDVWICHTIVYHLQGTFLRTVFQSPYIKETKPHQKGLVNQDTSNLLSQKVQLTFVFAHCFSVVLWGKASTWLKQRKM